MALLDQYGRPISAAVVRKSALAETAEVVRPGGQATGIDAGKLARILRDNDRGYNEGMLALAQEMPERCLHYFSALQTRSKLIEGAPINVIPGDDSEAAQQAADAFKKHVADQPNFRWLIGSLMDALNIGYSVVQPIWDTTTSPWTFREFRHYEPHRFMVHPDNLTELRIKKMGDNEGLPLTPGQFLVHMPRIRTGLPLRGSLARLAAVSWFCKTSTIKNWLIFADVYGMPVRVGKYDPNTTTEEEKHTLRQAIINIGHDAAAIIPRSMEIEFPDARRPTSGDNIYNGLAEYFDKQVSKAVLGQTMTSDDGSSLGQAKVHNDVRLDIAQADALNVSATLTYLGRMWAHLQNVIPFRIELDVSPPEDKAAKAANWNTTADAVTKLASRGYRLKREVIAEQLGVAVDDLEEGGAEDPAPVADPEAAANAAEVDDWEVVLAPHQAAVEQAAERADSYDAFLKQLESLPELIDSNPLVRELAIATAKERGLANAS